MTGRAIGLTSRDAAALLVKHGPNRYVPPARAPQALVWALRVATDPMVLLLLGAGSIYVWIGEPGDAIAAFVALVPIALIGVALELRTERALEQLRRLAADTALVERDGVPVLISAEDVVPGDLLQVREGDIVAAEGQVVEGTELYVDESPLTGEAEPLRKATGGDDLIYAGTSVLSGRARARVTATGLHTRYGRIASLLAETRTSSTPLYGVIRRLFGVLFVVAIVLCLAVVGLERARGGDWGHALIAGVSLAMAAIPEEIPIVFTLYLGIGAWRLARDHALIRRLAGVETLGMTTVICTDKTGTLTEGRLRLVEAQVAAGTERGELIRAGLLASEPEPIDPLDLAIAEVAGRADPSLRLVREYAFEAALRYTTKVWSDRQGGARAFSKGAVEAILELAAATPEERTTVLTANAALAEKAYRVVAVASGPVGVGGERRDDEADLRLLGLLAFADPIRPAVPAAIRECRAAGIRVVVVTGDHPRTALAVARLLGLAAGGDDGAELTGEEMDSLDDESLATRLAGVAVVARARPEQKLRLVRAFHALGEVVAVTGDGINDAPALREADIGVAMGQRGTAVAREAATLVLLDDDFSTIVRSVRDGRRIFDDLGKAISYLIAFHVPLALAALAIPLANAPLLLLPIHLVWLEVIVHPTSALVFQADPPDPEGMRHGPRRAASLLPSRSETILAVSRGIGLTIGVLALYFSALDRGEALARSLAVTALVLGQVLIVFIARAVGRPLWTVPVTGNAVLPLVVAGSLASILLVQHVPALAQLFRMQPLDPVGWAVAFAIAAAATLSLELVKVWTGRDPSIAAPAPAR